MIDVNKYSFLRPMPGYVVLREVEDETANKSLIKSVEQESRAYAYVIAIPHAIEYNGLKLGDLVCYNEFEGQELFKHGLVKEDHIIVIKVENIILKIEQDV